jgi:hypothetical protein
MSGRSLTGKGAALAGKILLTHDGKSGNRIKLELKRIWDEDKVM